MEEENGNTAVTIIKFRLKDEAKIYYSAAFLVVTPKEQARAVKYYEEVLRLMNEMVVLLRENNMMLSQHNRTIDELNERVRKIGVNTSNL